MSEQKIYHEFTKKVYDQQVMLRNGFFKMSRTVIVQQNLKMNVLMIVFYTINDNKN